MPSHADTPHLSVIVPTYDRLELLERCTDALRAQDVEVPYEILIADDGSVDSTTEFAADLARRDPRVHYLPAAHRGVAAAKNRGIANARADLLAFIDDDWVVAPDFCRRAIAFFDEYPARPAMTGRMVAPPGAGFVERTNHLQYETDMRLCLERRNTLRHHLRNFVAGTHYLLAPQPAPYISASGGLVLRRQVFDLVGVFDEELVIGEDTDLAWRMRARDLVLFYNPAIEIVHQLRPTLGATLRQQFQYGAGLRAFVERAPDHFALLPNSLRGMRRFASNLVMRPLKKALQTESVSEMLAFFPALFLINAVYTAGVVYGTWRRPRVQPS